MKIAYVITRSDEVGGAHIHVRDLAHWVKSKSHEVKVFVGGNGIFCEKLRELCIPVHSLDKMQRSISPIYDMLAVIELRKALKDFSPDIVSIHSAKAGLVGRIACRLLKIPFIFTAHGWSFARGKDGLKKMIFLGIEKVLSPMTGKIITVCNNDAQFALDNKICKSEKLLVIHNGMPEIPLHLVATPTNQIPVLIMVARFEYPKNHKQLIDSLSHLKEHPWKLLLIGDGPLTDEIRLHAQENGIDERIDFLGRRWDIAELLSTADIFVLTTFWEGFPRSIIEATRAGLPVVASNVAGIPEAVIDNENGFLVPVNGTEFLTDRLKHLMLNPDIREKQGKSSRKRYDDYFNFEITAQKTYKVYQDVLLEDK